MTRAELRTLTLQFLGTSADDPFYKTTSGASALDTLLQAAYDGLIAGILLQSPDYFWKATTVTTALAPSSFHEAALPSDFAGWRAVRLTDKTGERLVEVSIDDLPTDSASAFALSGADAGATLYMTTIQTLWVRYRYLPTWASGDAQAPSAVPESCHELLALVATKMAFAQGSEGRFPRELAERLDERMGHLESLVARRGPQAGAYVRRAASLYDDPSGWL